MNRFTIFVCFTLLVSVKENVTGKAVSNIGTNDSPKKNLENLEKLSRKKRFSAFDTAKQMIAFGRVGPQQARNLILWDFFNNKNRIINPFLLN